MDSVGSGYIPPLGELFDLLTITSLRVAHGVGDEANAFHLQDTLVSDISNRLAASQVELRSLLIELIRVSQVNQEIWTLKEKMTELDASSDAYKVLLVRAHQLNGFRNQAKNQLSALDTISTKLVRSNTGTDGLERG